MSTFADPNEIRARFCRAMSDMYRLEVPLYGDLVDLVETVNARVIAADSQLKARLEATDGLERISEERHGAIRLGTAEELHTMRRLFAVMGMLPVGYYDLSVAGIPVHSTAFRPVHGDALKHSPFRVFTSLLRSELILDPVLRQQAEQILASRDIFTPRARTLIAQFETDGGLSEADASTFITEALETFRWHSDARVSAQTYQQLHDSHRLVADVVSFRGPHINHLTPRTLNIDAVQAQMPERGITPKAVIEGPPPRNCPVLLRQTSFKALEEQIAFVGEAGEMGKHTARFGEIEQRGVALTRKGRALYDKLLDDARSLAQPKADGSNAAAYMQALSDVFAPLPDDYASLRRDELAYFHYSATSKPLDHGATDLDALVASNHIRFDPIVYEDFLPVSAAGIFQSNLGDNAAADRLDISNQGAFEAALGAKVQDEFALYEQLQTRSLTAALAALGVS